jgi:hypothetical protein
VGGYGGDSSHAAPACGSHATAGHEAPPYRPVTDPVWEQRLQALPTGTYPPEAAGLAPGQAVWLTISLGEPFAQDQYCYKLVAAVIPLPDPPGAP